MALSKERFTRAIANLGLEDERASKAVDDRASAALDRVKAMKELAEMDDERLLRYFNIIQAMEEVGRRKEEEIKEEDVAITERGVLNPEQEGLDALQANPVLEEAALREQINQPQLTEV